MNEREIKRLLSKMVDAINDLQDRMDVVEDFCVKMMGGRGSTSTSKSSNNPNNVDIAIDGLVDALDNTRGPFDKSQEEYINEDSTGQVKRVVKRGKKPLIEDDDGSAIDVTGRKTGRRAQAK